ncbi:zinc ribbon domain-containing protein [Eubacteriales bacterium OttesenSCG-928-K08]|nr:zinc ribbon domain-containing protein [Eubacteriales bacterium OttesenSCG-928-K08]
MRYCIKCGHGNVETALFCVECGALMGELSAAQPPKEYDTNNQSSDNAGQPTNSYYGQNNSSYSYGYGSAPRSPGDSTQSGNVPPQYGQTYVSTNSNNSSETLSVGQYVGYIIVMLLPLLIGLIFSIIWACQKENINKRNLAISMLILRGICLVLGIILLFAFVGIVTTVAEEMLEIFDGYGGFDDFYNDFYDNYNLTTYAVSRTNTFEPQLAG